MLVVCKKEIKYMITFYLVSYMSRIIFVMKYKTWNVIFIEIKNRKCNRITMLKVSSCHSVAGISTHLHSHYVT